MLRHGPGRLRHSLYNTCGIGIPPRRLRGQKGYMMKDGRVTLSWDEVVTVTVCLKDDAERIHSRIERYGDPSGWRTKELDQINRLIEKLSKAMD